MAERVTRPAELGRLGSHLRGRPRNGTFLAWDREDDGLDLSALGFWRALRAPRLCLQGLGSGCTERSVGQRLRRAGCGGHGGPSEPGNTPWLPPRSALALARFQVRQAEGLRLPCRAGPSCGGLRRRLGPGSGWRSGGRSPLSTAPSRGLTPVPDLNKQSDTSPAKWVYLEKTKHCNSRHV